MTMTGPLPHKEADLKDRIELETQFIEMRQLWILGVMWNKIRCNYNVGI
jgi:hypothetical protein